VVASAADLLRMLNEEPAARKNVLFGDDLDGVEQDDELV
jgi:hypothetical protein